MPNTAEKNANDQTQAPPKLRFGEGGLTQLACRLDGGSYDTQAEFLRQILLSYFHSTAGIQEAAFDAAAAQAGLAMRWDDIIEFKVAGLNDFLDLFRQEDSWLRNIVRRLLYAWRARPQELTPDDVMVIFVDAMEEFRMQLEIACSMLKNYPALVREEGGLAADSDTKEATNGQ